MTDLDEDDTPDTGPDALVTLLQIRVRERVAERRARARISQAELGRRLGMSRQHASAFETGRFGVSTKRLAMLEDVGFDLTELVQADPGPTRYDLARVVFALMSALAYAETTEAAVASEVLALMTEIGIDAESLAVIIAKGDEQAAKLAAARES